eukprot:scaffold18065_cov59-Phaeocystis_antarctica.AAC.3
MRALGTSQTRARARSAGSLLSPYQSIITVITASPHLTNIIHAKLAKHRCPHRRVRRHGRHAGVSDRQCCPFEVGVDACDGARGVEGPLAVEEDVVAERHVGPEEQLRRRWVAAAAAQCGCVDEHEGPVADGAVREDREPQHKGILIAAVAVPRRGIHALHVLRPAHVPIAWRRRGVRRASGWPSLQQVAAEVQGVRVEGVVRRLARLHRAEDVGAACRHVPTYDLLPSSAELLGQVAVLHACRRQLLVAEAQRRVAADCHAVARKLEDASTSSLLDRRPDVCDRQQVARAGRKVSVDVEPTVTTSALAGRAVARARHVDEDGRVVRIGCEEHATYSVARARLPSLPASSRHRDFPTTFVVRCSAWRGHLRFGAALRANLRTFGPLTSPVLLLST